MVPPIPVDPPNLSRTQDEERQFDAGVLDISYLTTDNERNMNYTNVTAFIVRVESDNGTDYIFQVMMAV